MVKMSMGQEQCLHLISLLPDMIHILLRTICHINCKALLCILIYYHITVRFNRSKYKSLNFHIFPL